MSDITPNPKGSIIDASLVACDYEGITLAPLAAKRVAIDFAMQDQCYSNWCWAAVAASIAGYYAANTSWRQCMIANKELHRRDCCEVPCHEDGVAYNVVNTLGSPLHRVRHLASVKFRQATREEVRHELEAGQPVCVRTEWRGGGAHFVAIIAYSEDSDMLSVCDPLHGRSEILFDRFRDAYTLSRGHWTHSYYTKPQSRSRLDRRAMTA